MTIAVAMASAPAPTFAKSKQIVPPGALILAGAPVRCGFAYTIVAPIDDIAMAYPSYIILDPGLFAMPDAIQHFWYAHECAHFLFGYRELAADCWAIQTGKRMGWFRAEDFAWMELNFAFLRGDAEHPAGPKRLANLKRCYAKVPAIPSPLRQAQVRTAASYGPGG